MDQSPIIIIKDAWTWIKFQKLLLRMLVHGSNPNHHGCLDMDQIPIIIIKDACTWIKSQYHHQGCLDIDKIPTIIIINRYK